MPAGHVWARAPRIEPAPREPAPAPGLRAFARTAIEQAGAGVVARSTTVAERRCERLVGMASEPHTPSPDPIDVEMAHVDARDPNVAEEIEQVEDDAEALGREVDQPRPTSE